jgi:hypothetical protein
MGWSAQQSAQPTSEGLSAKPTSMGRSAQLALMGPPAEPTLEGRVGGADAGGSVAQPTLKRPVGAADAGGSIGAAGVFWPLLSRRPAAANRGTPSRPSRSTELFDSCPYLDDFCHDCRTVLLIKVAPARARGDLPDSWARGTTPLGRGVGRMRIKRAFAAGNRLSLWIVEPTGRPGNRRIPRFTDRAPRNPDCTPPRAAGRPRDPTARLPSRPPALQPGRAPHETKIPVPRPSPPGDL